MGKCAITMLLGLSVFFQLLGHVELVSPHGGESYVPGNVVTVQWKETIRHETMNWDLLFSSDGGLTWVTQKADISLETVSYQWVVPEIPTMEGRIKIVQDNVSTDYSGESQNFTITYPVGIADPFVSTNMIVYPNPVAEFATIEFKNPLQKSFSLLLFDFHGRLVGNRAQITSERVTIYRKDLASGVYFLQLREDEKIYAERKLVIK